MLDPDPIDCQGHGTAVADIAAGRSNDGTWKGIAPGAELYAVKVCSAVSTSCSIVAELLGLEFAIDPDGDGDLSDAVDVVNISLGSEYGTRENPSGFAVSVLSGFGIVVVSAAGNQANRQYIVDAPSSSPEAISVAQTQVSDAVTYPLILNPPVPDPSCSGAVCTNTFWQPWSERPTFDITGPLYIPEANQLGCDPFAPGALAGYIALIRRGDCDASVKTSNASNAGAVGIVIDNNVAGAPPPFGLGGGSPPFRTTISITQQLGDTLRSRAGTPVTGGKIERRRPSAKLERSL